MGRITRRAIKGLRRLIARLDAAFNALYGWKYNPLYHSGALAVAAFVALLGTGLYLIFFYRIGAPYASVARITGQAWTGRWIRGIHRYASDVAVVAAAVHAARMFVQDRSWGPRALAWVSGLGLVFLFFVCGWTGYVMVWDVQAKLLAEEGARIMDALPIFSEPIRRTFVGEQPIPGAFFFLNLFAHIALPVGVALALWIHVSRIARPSLLPPRRLMWGVAGLFLALALVWPLSMDAKADLFSVPRSVSVDAFYTFWLPVTRAFSPGWVWTGFLAVSLVLVAVPWAVRPRAGAAPTPYVVNERFCTGCSQCALDCPYEAISMFRRGDGREGLVARVDPDLCVSCGICAGSCAPMGVGPPRRTGRDQLVRVKQFVDRHAPTGEDVILVACTRGAGGVGAMGGFAGAPVFPVSCAGSLHTSVIEYLVRSGAGGVLVASCPPRDCWNREGVKWLEERVYYEREAELKERVDRSRVRLVCAGEAEIGRVAAALEAFRAEVRALGRSAVEEGIEIDTECDVPDPEALDKVMG